MLNSSRITLMLHLACNSNSNESDTALLWITFVFIVPTQAPHTYIIHNFLLFMLSAASRYSYMCLLFITSCN